MIITFDYASHSQQHQKHTFQPLWMNTKRNFSLKIIHIHTLSSWLMKCLIQIELLIQHHHHSKQHAFNPCDLISYFLLYFYVQLLVLCPAKKKQQMDWMFTLGMDGDWSASSDWKESKRRVIGGRNIDENTDGHSSIISQNSWK